MRDAGGLWRVPGAVLVAVGLLALVAGFATGGPDAVGGVVFGGLAPVAAAVILRRRAPRSPGPAEQEREN
jgi:membrane protein implicated in regulation of membrane protease activity